MRIRFVIDTHSRRSRFGGAQWFVLTWHTLIMGNLGRTELAASAEEGARTTFASVQRLKRLPDYVEVLPR